ncbi:MAG: putative sulfoacetate transporter SauU [Chlamydiae bacterium]|nr:putative sulfoacetate transporter SauU [Chlamydiota bacterium]
MTKSRNLRWWIWALAAFFYFYEYLLRVSPNIMVPELMQAFNVNAGELGILVASFLAIYAPMQLPVGILMDRFGARLLLTFASLGCGIGAFVFALSNSIGQAFVGRILIGLCSSFAFVGMVYVCSHWFEKERRALLVGAANSISMLGAFAGGGPLSIMVQKIGWRSSLIFWAFIGIVLAAVIYFVIRKDTPHETDSKPASETPNTLFEGIKIFFTSVQNWINALVALLAYTVTTAVGGLWGVQFIQNAYGVRKEVASFAASMLFFGWMVGGPVMGFISDKLRNRKYIISLGVLGTLLAFAPIVYYTSMSIFWVYILIFLTGLFSASQLICFTFATEINPHRVKGASIAITNFLVAIGGTIVQPLIGYLLQSSANKNLKGAAQQFTLQNYKYALTVLPICLIAAWFLSLLLKDDGRKHQPF